MMHQDDANRALVRVEVVDGVALVVLNDPARRNALTARMRTELIDSLDMLEARDDVIGFVVTGEGPAFCAGAHLGDLARAKPEDFRYIYEAFLRIARSRLPTVAAVNGPAVGAGLNVALACDVRLAGRRARFIPRFLELGLHPGGGHTWMLTRLVGPEVASAMLLLACDLDGEEAARLGLALRCVDDELLISEALKLAGRAGRAPRELVMRVKETLSATQRLDTLDDAVLTELDAQVWSSRQPFFRERVAMAADAARGRPKGSS
jgi:enoyl-CoA hydratase